MIDLPMDQDAAANLIDMAEHYLNKDNLTDEQRLSASNLIANMKNWLDCEINCYT